MKAFKNLIKGLIEDLFSSSFDSRGFLELDLDNKKLVESLKIYFF